MSPKSCSVALTIVLLVTGGICVPPAVASSLAAAAGSQERGKGSEQPNPETKYGKEANPGTVFKETKGRSSTVSRGMEMRQLHGRQAGKPVSSLRGAKSVSRDEWMKMKAIPKTGLYLVSLDHVPAGLENDLQENGYKLAEDGTLTRNGNPVALFVVGETFLMRPKKDAGPPAGKAGGGGMAARAGHLLMELARAVDALITSDVEAAAPFPWRCGSWNFRWEYDGGFCREYRAWSSGYAWGPGADGVCADPKPLTNIDYISTYVNNSGRTDWDYHYYANQSHSYAVWDIGCFWPAHGGGSGYHYAYWRDGSAWMYRTWSW